MQSAFRHHADYSSDAQHYRDSTKPIPLHLERQVENDLSVFMLELFQDLLPSRDSHQKRIQLTKKIERILHNEWPDYNMQVYIFGSSVNNLGTSNSDVDLCITSPCVGFPDVRVLATLFQSYNMRSIVCVPGAKVPIVRFFDPEFQLACDININNTVALENTKMVKTYVALDHRIRPLIMIIKHWTKQRDLNNAAYGGTLSSYAWTCMIINFLQTRSPPILPSLHGGRERFSEDVDRFCEYGSKNKETLGGLLFAFFRKFAIEFDYDTQVLSVHQGKILSKSEKGWDVGRNSICMCVEEPFSLTRNLGNSADPASVRGIRTECDRVISLLIWEKAGFSHLFDPYFSMRFSSYQRHHVQPPLLQQTVFYNTPIYNSINHPFVYPNSNSSNNNNDLNHRHQQQQRHQQQRHQQQQLQQQQQQQQQAPYGNYIVSPRQNSLIDINHEGNYHNISSTLLTMLNLTDNYSHDHSVDSIFARYHREVLEDNDRRRPSSSSKNIKEKVNAVPDDWPMLKDEYTKGDISDEDVNKKTEKKKNKPTQEQHPQKTLHKKLHNHQNQNQKQEKSAKQPQQEKLNKDDKQPQHEKQNQNQKQDKTNHSTSGRHRRWSVPKRKHQQEQKDHKQQSTPTNAAVIATVDVSTKQQPPETTENNHSTVENNSTTKHKNHRKKNKHKRRRQKSNSNELEKKV